MVAKYKSVNRAAELLFVSQPAVSNGLKKFQQEIELELFEKLGRRIVLTSTGEKLAKLTGRLFNAEKDVEQFISEITQKRRGTMQMGVATLYERFAMVDLMTCFDNTDSNITLSVTSGNSRSLLKSLKDHKVDMIISGSMGVNEQYSFNFLRKHQICLVVPEEHNLYGKSSFSLDDLVGEPMVMKEEGSAVRRAVDSYLLEHDVAFNIKTELSNLDSILEVASKEKCITFLPDLAFEHILSHSSPFSVSYPTQGELSFSMYLITLPENSYPRWLWNRIQSFAEKACSHDVNSQ
jgi:DNA-binding transcriptional LysR family regulator